MRSNSGEQKMTKFGTVQVGFGFECEKNDGKQYAGHIVKVAAYSRGTLVTIRWDDEEGPNHRSLYLEDCKVWFTEEPSLV
jgi:hypothetical protein